MKNKVLLFLMGIFLLAGCASSLSSSEKGAKQTRIAQQVKEMLEARRYTIDVNYVYPKQMAPRHLSHGYSLRVSGDSVVSYLPFFGRAYRVPYGGGKGLDFSAPIAAYRVAEGKKGTVIIEMAVDTNEDSFVFFIELFGNGQASVNVSARERDGISYTGQVQGLE